MKKEEKLKKVAEVKDFLKKFKKLPWFLAKHSFWVIIALSFLAVLLGSFLFYYYVIQASEQELQVDGSHIKFRKDIYENIVERWALPK